MSRRELLLSENELKKEQTNQTVQKPHGWLITSLTPLMLTDLNGKRSLGTNNIVIHLSEM